jgi:glutaconate CoA-transferase subunit A
MSAPLPLADAVESLLGDGESVALEGFTHLIPFAAGHEIIRQARRELTVMRLTPDLIADQLIGAGCVRRLVFSWGGNPGVGSLHRFREAVESGFPAPLELEEHSHAGMANRYVAGASGLPFALLRGYAGTDLVEHSETIAPIECPFTGERLYAVKALRPDLTVIHAQRADRAGNVQLWGITGVQKEAVLAARRSLVTVEELVDELEPMPGAITLPGWVLSCVSVVPGGAAPSYAQGYYERDNAAYRRWEPVSRSREAFARWLAEDVRGASTAEAQTPIAAGAAPASVVSIDAGEGALASAGATNEAIGAAEAGEAVQESL